MFKIKECKLEKYIHETWLPVDHAEAPRITAEDYYERMRKLWMLKEAEAYNSIIIYADREHFSNLYYFTGLDMRFEEALLVLYRDMERRPVIVLGNEDMNYSRIIPYELNRVMYQTFSLMGQPNDQRSLTLDEILNGLSLPSGKIGLIGWKNYDKSLHKGFELVTDVPHYIVESLIKVVGKDRLENVTSLLTDCVYGLKHNVSAKEVIQFEILGAKNSRSVYNCIRNLKVGQTEIDASKYLEIDGDPLATHPNVNFGDTNTSYGLSGPDWYTSLKMGDFVGVGYGVRGANVHKAGIYAASEEDIPEERKDFFEKMLKPYFATVARWYEMMQIGVKAGDVWQMVEDQIGFEKFGIGLNPGHLGHTDEWTNSPFEKGSQIQIHSGMVLQCDFTAMMWDPYMTCHIEDGLVIADQELRAQISQLAPNCMKRFEQRRLFMKQVLGINLPDEVLPLSDIAGVCFPYMADLKTVMAIG